jgi:hypothetical protein
MAFVVLMALLGSGLAHASRLCGVVRHTAARTASAVHCPAHHAAAAAAVPEAQPPAAPLHVPARAPEPACCASGTSFAALPAARAEIGRNDVAALTPPVAVAARTLAPQTCAAPVPERARAPVSGARLHLVQRILLI